MRWSVIRSLLWKETRQLGRNRSAILSATLLPFVILFIAPIQLILSIRLGSTAFQQMRGGPPGLTDTSDPMQLVLQLVYPLLLVLGGLLLPSLTTTYAIVAERERRSLELLISLPVTVSEILAAKLLAVLVLTAIIGLPYIAVVLTLLLVLGIATPAAVPALLAPFLAAVICSTGIALLLTLLARDFRTANNLNGAFFMPILLLSIGILSVIGGEGRTYVLSFLLVVIAALCFVAALRWVSFERYLE